MGNLVFFGFSIMVTAGILSLLFVIFGDPIAALTLIIGSVMMGCAFIFSDNQPNQPSDFEDTISKLKAWW